MQGIDGERHDGTFDRTGAFCLRGRRDSGSADTDKMGRELVSDRQREVAGDSPVELHKA